MSGVLLRPVLDMLISSLNKTVEWLSSILKPSQNSEGKYNMRDSIELVERTKHYPTIRNCMLSSVFEFPLTSMVSYVYQMMDTLNIDIGLPTLTLKELLVCCTTNVEFLFRKHFYWETDGVAMRSPLELFFCEYVYVKIRKRFTKRVNHQIW